MEAKLEPYEYVKKRLSAMESNRGTWEDHWQEILDYVMPRKADVTLVRAKGEKELMYYLIVQQSLQTLF